MNSNYFFGNYYFPTTGQLLMGAVAGTIAGFLLVIWLGDNIDRIMSDLRFIGHIFWKKKNR